MSVVITAWMFAERWFPTPLMASNDRKTFPFGSRRRDREASAPEGTDPELLGDVAEGHYGGGTAPTAPGPVSTDQYEPLPTILVPLRDPFAEPADHDVDADADAWASRESTDGPPATEAFAHALDRRPEPFEDLVEDAESEDADPKSSIGWMQPIALAPVSSPEADEDGAGPMHTPTQLELAGRSADLATMSVDGDGPVRNIARWALQRLIDHEESERRLELAHAAPPESLIDHALYAAAIDAYTAGTATPTIDGLVEHLGLNVELTEQEAWRLGAQLDTRLAAYTNRTLAHAAFPYLYLTTFNVKIREGSPGHVVTRSAALVMGVTENGDREVLAVDIANNEDEARWNLLLLDLRRRGLSGTQLVVSVSEGLPQAVRLSLPRGASWQSCRNQYGRRFAQHFAPDERARAEEDFAHVFDSDSCDEIESRWHDLVLRVADRFPNIAEEMLTDGPDVLAFTWFPAAHWRKIASTSAVDPIVRFIRKQMRLIGVMPNEVAARRVLTAAAAYQHEQLGESRRFLTGVASAKIEAARSSRRTHDAGEPLTGVDRRRADRRSDDRRRR